MLGIGIALWILVPADSAEPPSPVVSFVESKGLGVDRIAVFSVKNIASRRAVWMGDVQIQVAENAGWRTISQDDFHPSPFVQHGTPQHFPQFLGPGEHRMFVVDWPAAQPWRVSVEYRQDAKGIEALVAKVRIIWATRTMLSWRSRVSVDPRWVASVEVQESSRTNHSSQQPPADP